MKNVLSLFILLSVSLSTAQQPMPLHQIVTNFTNSIQQLKNYIKNDNKTEKSGNEIMSRIYKVIEELPLRYYDEATKQILAVISNFPTNLKNEYNFHALNDVVKWMDHLLKNITKYNYERFVRIKGNAILGSLKFMYSKILPRDDERAPWDEGVVVKTRRKRILDSLTNAMDNTTFLCQLHQSPNQFLYNFYNILAITEFKAFVIIQISNLILQYRQNNFKSEFSSINEIFRNRSIQLASHFKAIMGSYKTDYWICDPDIHKKGETFEEITRLLQGIIMNEVDLSSTGTCINKCTDYKHTKSHTCYDNECIPNSKCNGKIYECQTIENDVEYCPTESKNLRRFDYIHLTPKQSNTQCSKAPKQAQSWRRWIFWKCDYCLCICDETSLHSDRYFSLKPTVSDVKNNYVVTAVRMIKKNRIIHMQIQQGKLLKGALIDDKTLGWLPVGNLTITGREKNGVDYHQLTYEKRSLNIDEVMVADNYVVTGVRFALEKDALQLQIAQSSFNIETGKLNPTFQWIKSTNNRRSEIPMDSCDVPTRTSKKNLLNSKSNQYIKFTNSDLNKDAAQTTIPFIDIQPVVADISLPLQGVGVFHKGVPKFGGYIGLKTFSFKSENGFKPIFENLG